MRSSSDLLSGFGLSERDPGRGSLDVERLLQVAPLPSDKKERGIDRGRDMTFEAVC